MGWNVLGTLPSGDGGAVDSVNGHVGEVELDAADVGAVQAGSLATVAETGEYGDLLNLPTLGTAAGEDVEAFDPAGAADAAQDASLQIDLNLADLTDPSAARANLEIVEPWTPQPSDQGLIGWSFDPTSVSTGAVITSGTMFTAKIPIRQTSMVTNIVLYISTAGSGLTAGQSFATLYQNNVLLGVTADQSGSWNSTGLKTMAVVGGPYVANPGFIEVGFWSVGTTPPAVARAATFLSQPANAGITGTNGRFCTTHSALTTTAPNPISARSLGLPWWAAVS
jgi:hypothetical protein